MLPKFLAFVGDAVLVAHNASFDVGFIEQNCRYQDIIPDFTSVDTVAMARILLPTLSKFKLNVVANALHISSGESSPGRWTMQELQRRFLLKFVEMHRDRNVDSLRKLNSLELTMPMQCVSFRLIMSLFLLAMR